MNKNHIETFIKKYHLNGLFDQVRWVSENKTLKSTTMSSDKKFLHSVELKNWDGFGDAEVGIQDTARIKNMIGSLNDPISIDLIFDTPPSQPELPDMGGTDPAKRIISMTLSDATKEYNYVAADLDVIQKAPQLKSTPVYDVEIKLSDTFITSFTDAKATLPECDLFTLIMSKKKNVLQMVLGYSETVNTMRCQIDVPAEAGKDVVKKPISFSAKALKEIINANSECKDAVLKVSEQGLSYIEYDNDPFLAKYYMMKIDTE